MDAPYERHPKADERIESANIVIEALLRLKDQLYRPMLKKFLSNCLWQITQAEGKNKYALRCQSRASQGLPRKELRHEHVVPRKVMVEALLAASPDKAREIVKDAVGCVVTKEEHNKLTNIDRKHPDLKGWDRYVKAKIVVIDMVTGTRRPEFQ